MSWSIMGVKGLKTYPLYYINCLICHMVEMPCSSFFFFLAFYFFLLTKQRDRNLKKST